MHCTVCADVRIIGDRLLSNLELTSFVLRLQFYELDLPQASVIKQRLVDRVLPDATKVWTLRHELCQLASSLKECTLAWHGMARLQSASVLSTFTSPSCKPLCLSHGQMSFILESHYLIFELVLSGCFLQYPRPVFVGADLSQCSLQQALQGTGFDPAKDSLFLCEGLLYYLPQV